MEPTGELEPCAVIYAVANTLKFDRVILRLIGSALLRVNTTSRSGALELSGASLDFTHVRSIAGSINVGTDNTWQGETDGK